MAWHPRAWPALLSSSTEKHENLLQPARPWRGYPRRGGTPSTGLQAQVRPAVEDRDKASLSWFPRACPSLWRSTVEVGPTGSPAWIIRFCSSQQRPEFKERDPASLA